MEYSYTLIASTIEIIHDYLNKADSFFKTPHSVNELQPFIIKMDGYHKILCQIIDQGDANQCHQALWCFTHTAWLFRDRFYGSVDSKRLTEILTRVDDG